MSCVVNCEGSGYGSGYDSGYGSASALVSPGLGSNQAYGSGSATGGSVYSSGSAQYTLATAGGQALCISFGAAHFAGDGHGDHHGNVAFVPHHQCSATESPPTFYFKRPDHFVTTRHVAFQNGTLQHQLGVEVNCGNYVNNADVVLMNGIEGPRGRRWRLSSHMVTVGHTTLRLINDGWKNSSLAGKDTGLVLGWGAQTFNACTKQNHACSATNTCPMGFILVPQNSPNAVRVMGGSGVSTGFSLTPPYQVGVL